MLASLAVAFALGSPPSTGRVELVSSQEAVQAGRSFVVGIRLEPAEGYHTYWMNPGDSGSPTTITWHLPKGWKTVDQFWPTPSRISTAGSISYGYVGRATILTIIVAPDSLRGKSVTVAGRVEWLTCTSQMCVPAKGDFLLKLPVAAKAVKNPAWPLLMADAVKHLPMDLRKGRALAHLDGKTVILSLIGPGSQLKKPGIPYFFPDAAGMISHSKPQSFSSEGGSLTGRLPVSEYAVKPPTRLSGVLKAPDGNAFAGGVKAVYIDVPITRSSGSSGSQEKSHA